MDFKEHIKRGIPGDLPEMPTEEDDINHAPKRKDILNTEEKKLALKNALRYFPKKLHEKLAPEFAEELKKYGRIYMKRFRPPYEMKARNINEYPAKTKEASAIMLMIQNNLDKAVAQHPYELITYGGNGAVFQNWAQYLLTMKYLSEMTEEQTLVMYSGHPLGLFPSAKDSPRVVVTNGMVIPNYSTKDHYEKFNALGVTQYGQMTAGSYMYIGPQGIVHGTTITVLNAGRKYLNSGDLSGKLFVSSGLGGMSGAQAKAAVIAGAVGVLADINPKAVETRSSQGWVQEVYKDLDEMVKRVKTAKQNKEAVSIAYQGNIVDLWEKFYDENIEVELGSDQTSLHNPFAGGYYPAGLSFDESNKMMSENPEQFKEEVYKSLRRQVEIINKHCSRGMYFWDYGNAFLLESKRAGADILKENGSFRYPSYVEDIMGPMCFNYGFGPFRWVCTSNKAEDLHKSDQIAADILRNMAENSPEEIKQQ
ncbi:MAG: urocanate hydratase, partial [Spirochaetota bacterium]